MCHDTPDVGGQADGTISNAKDAMSNKMSKIGRKGAELSVLPGQLILATLPDKYGDVCAAMWAVAEPVQRDRRRGAHLRVSVVRVVIKPEYRRGHPPPPGRRNVKLDLLLAIIDAGLREQRLRVAFTLADAYCITDKRGPMWRRLFRTVIDWRPAVDFSGEGLDETLLGRRGYVPELPCLLTPVVEPEPPCSGDAALSIGHAPALPPPRRHGNLAGEGAADADDEADAVVDEEEDDDDGLFEPSGSEPLGYATDASGVADWPNGDCEDAVLSIGHAPALPSSRGQGNPRKRPLPRPRDPAPRHPSVDRHGGTIPYLPPIFPPSSYNVARFGIHVEARPSGIPGGKAGRGLFAKVQLPLGTVIPYGPEGCRIYHSSTDALQAGAPASHLYVSHEVNGGCIDGSLRPGMNPGGAELANYPYHDVTLVNLNLHPRLKDLGHCCRTLQVIEAGEEIFADYTPQGFLKATGLVVMRTWWLGSIPTETPLICDDFTQHWLYLKFIKGEIPACPLLSELCDCIDLQLDLEPASSSAPQRQTRAATIAAMPTPPMRGPLRPVEKDSHGAVVFVDLIALRDSPESKALTDALLQQLPRGQVATQSRTARAERTRENRERLLVEITAPSVFPCIVQWLQMACRHESRAGQALAKMLRPLGPSVLVLGLHWIIAHVKGSRGVAAQGAHSDVDQKGRVVGIALNVFDKMLNTMIDPDATIDAKEVVHPSDGGFRRAETPFMAYDAGTPHFGSAAAPLPGMPIPHYIQGRSFIMLCSASLPAAEISALRDDNALRHKQRRSSDCIIHLPPGPPGLR